MCNIVWDVISERSYNLLHNKIYVKSQHLFCYSMFSTTLLLCDDDTTYQDYVSSVWRTHSDYFQPVYCMFCSVSIRVTVRRLLMYLHPCLCSCQVDIKNQGKTALQVAAHQGHMEVVKALLQANSSIEVKDEDGDTALHYTAFG